MSSKPEIVSDMIAMRDAQVKANGGRGLAMPIVIGIETLDDWIAALSQTKSDFECSICGAMYPAEKKRPMCPACATKSNLDDEQPYHFEFKDGETMETAAQRVYREGYFAGFRQHQRSATAK